MSNPLVLVAAGIVVSLALATALAAIGNRQQHHRPEPAFSARAMVLSHDNDATREITRRPPPPPRKASPPSPPRRTAIGYGDVYDGGLIHSHRALAP